ncbi:MAG: hypothetical protein ACRDOI_00785 [Trebonia sp.]
MSLDPSDAMEHTQLLQLIAGWLDSDPARLGPSLLDYIGHPAYSLADLHAELDRFRVLLGGDDGEAFFGHADL